MVEGHSKENIYKWKAFHLGPPHIELVMDIFIVYLDHLFDKISYPYQCFFFFFCKVASVAISNV
jgi:hypothetical protein